MHTLVAVVFQLNHRWVNNVLVNINQQYKVYNTFMESEDLTRNSPDLLIKEAIHIRYIQATPMDRLINRSADCTSH